MKNVVNVITAFDNNGTEDTFNMPYGVAVSENGQVYVADSQNHRVVVLEKDATLVKIVENPKSESLDDNYVFTPLKVTVDYADRIYVIAQNMFEGIMVFESNGNFSSFFGTIKVEITLWENSGRDWQPRRSVPSSSFTSLPNLPVSISTPPASYMQPTLMPLECRVSDD